MLHLQSVLPGLRPGIALDIGTRFGEFAGSLSEVMPEGSRIIAIDRDPDVIAKAREKTSDRRIEFQVGDACHLDFADDSVEVAAISNTLHHLENYGAVLDEMLRVLTPGGLLLVNEMFQDGQNAAQQTHVLQHTLEAELDMISGGYQRPTWKRAELISILDRLPLSDVNIVEMYEEPEMDQKLAAKNKKLTELVEQKAAGHPQLNALRSQAEAIQKRCAQVGIQRCTQLVYFGRK